MQSVVVLLVVVTVVCPILGYSPPPNQIPGHVKPGFRPGLVQTLPGTHAHVSAQRPGLVQTIPGFPGNINGPHISPLNPGLHQTLPGTINRPHISPQNPGHLNTFTASASRPVISHGLTTGTSFKQTRPVNRPFRRQNTNIGSFRRTYYGRR
ncbi:hypothetical protein Pmani_025639 [Petrolisthes manimaculis]|uniref:Uncharacterized protein n=1 Tax=Petrolisthes manimaculis TaxID=1843537 RepID=A0AAE1P5S2_9EUCA|nr:hypothetical protein Pmani_025639 [Petrolisthes manimaculis]